jgi:uncharacterized membrane protein
MSNKEHITDLLDYFQNTEGRPLIFDEEAIVSAYQKDSDTQSLPIKILSVFGGLLASVAFLGFFFASGLNRSEIGLLAFSGIFIVGSILISKKYDRIIIDTVSVSFFIIGFILMYMALHDLRINEDMISIVFIIIAFGTLCFVQNYILTFIAVLIINGSFLMLILSNNAYNLIHFQVAVLALAMVYFFLKEAQIITANNIFSKLYNPVRTGIMFSFLAGLLLLGKRGILPISPDYIWMSSIITISSIVYLISMIFNVLSITETRHKASIYLFAVLTLLPTALSPAISGAILIILLSFLVNYKTGLVVGIISFIYFISQYYYDLNFTLLTKSILLLASGVLFITLYLFTHKKLTTNEKI